MFNRCLYYLYLYSPTFLLLCHPWSSDLVPGCLWVALVNLVSNDLIPEDFTKRRRRQGGIEANQGSEIRLRCQHGSQKTFANLGPELQHVASFFRWCPATTWSETFHSDHPGIVNLCILEISQQATPNSQRRYHTSSTRTSWGRKFPKIKNYSLEDNWNHRWRMKLVKADSKHGFRRQSCKIVLFEVFLVKTTLLHYVTTLPNLTTFLHFITWLQGTPAGRSSFQNRISTPKLQNCIFEAFLIKNLKRKWQPSKSGSLTSETRWRSHYNAICSIRAQNTMAQRKQAHLGQLLRSHCSAICTGQLQNTLVLRTK